MKRSIYAVFSRERFTKVSVNCGVLTEVFREAIFTVLNDCAVPKNLLETLSFGCKES